MPSQFITHGGCKRIVETVTISFTVPDGPLPPKEQQQQLKIMPERKKQSNLCFPVIFPETAQDCLHSEHTKSNHSLLKKKKSYYKLHLTQVCIVCQFLSNCKLDQGCLLGGKSSFWSMSYWLGVNYLQQICEANSKQACLPATLYWLGIDIQLIFRRKINIVLAAN